jgi:hypothetical protein
MLNIGNSMTDKKHKHPQNEEVTEAPVEAIESSENGGQAYVEIEVLM